MYYTLLPFGSCWERGVCIWDVCLSVKKIFESCDLGETSNGAKSLEMEARDVAEIELVTEIFYSPPDQN